MKAIKGNKVYTVNEKQERHYQEAGYDIYDDDGDVLAYGRGKTVPYETYAQVARELEELKGRQGEDGTQGTDGVTTGLPPGNTRPAPRTHKQAGKKAP